MSTQISRVACALLATTAFVAPALISSALAADPVTLPTVNVTGQKTGGGTLTVPGVAAAKEQIQQIPGGVAVVGSEQWRDTQATTLKDVLDYTPGVFVQPKWGEDTRLSIRGSGLARNFHLRGVSLLQNGMPLNAADGSGDFQELDPTAFRYTEVYKGANGLRYGANSLGGAINFVTQTGRDASPLEGRVDVGSYGFKRLQLSSGGATDKVDGFVTGSWQQQDGFRDHSYGRSIRASGNVGVKLADNAESRIFVNVAEIDQKIPGSVNRATALTSPKTAAAGNLLLNYQRNMDSVRLGNRTVVDLGPTQLEFGAYYNAKHLIHPIYQYLDYQYRDYGVFARAVDERKLGELNNRLTLGVNFGGGYVDGKNYVNLPGGKKGAQLAATKDSSVNTLVYAEDALEVVRNVELIVGAQYQRALRDRQDKFAPAPDVSGSQDYDLFSPRLGVLWRVDPTWQVFAGVARSVEAPTLTELNFTNARLSDTKPQKATTYEIGARGERPDIKWDVTLYRSHLKNEFQFFDLGGGNIQVTNADKTIHQGIEAGLSWDFLKGLAVQGTDPDKLTLNAAYTFSDFRFDGDRTWRNNDLPGAPRHYLRAEVLYKSPSGWYAGPNVEWVPQAYYVDNANTASAKTESYALLGAKVGVDLTEKVGLYIDGRNLLDKKYISSASTAATATAASALYEPGTGRTVFVGLRAKW
jgi:iron complex outermembrane recepter protein